MLKAGRLIGVDHGIKRMGVATCDLSWLVARELEVIKRRSRQEDFERLNAIAAEQDAIGFVIGLPFDVDAPPDTHTQADTVRLWVERFSVTTALPIILWDETLSSEDAKLLAKHQRRKPDAPIDDLAARLILQSYLDALRDGLATFPLRGHT